MILKLVQYSYLLQRNFKPISQTDFLSSYFPLEFFHKSLMVRSLTSNKKYVMVKDLDILVHLNDEQKQLYTEASFQKGKQMLRDSYIRTQTGQKYSLSVPIEEFERYGPGIYLLFLFLKYASGLFLVVSVVSLVNLGLLAGNGDLNAKYTNFQSKMAETTLANVKGSQFTVIVVVDVIITLIIFTGVVYWKQKQPNFVVQCCKEVMLPSYHTVILKQLPELYTEYDTKVFLEERFGEIKEIYTVRNFKNDLYYYKQITKVVGKFKEERALLAMESQRSSINLTKLFLDYQKLYFHVQRQSKLAKYPKQFAFVTFKSVKSREQMLKFYQHTFLSIKEQNRNYYLYKGEELKIKPCMMEPNGIKWQNLNIATRDKFIWASMQICLLIIVLLLSVLVIFIFYVAESSLSHSEYFGMQKKEILSLHNTQALQSYCLSLSISDFRTDEDCNKFEGQYLKYTVLFVALPIAIALFKFILTELMKLLVGVRRHPYEITKIQSQIVIMFLFYFFATGVLQYIVFLEITFDDNSTFSFVNIVRPIKELFVGYLNIDTSKITMSNDFNKEWYLTAAHKIILIAIASFNISSFGKIVYSFMRKIFCDFMARRQKLQCRMNYWLEGEQMEIQFVYAVAATIICFSLLFGASIPLVYPFGCISLFILYWSTKFIFINFCGKPLLYSHSMNSLMVNILAAGVILHCFTAPLFLGASTIFSEKGIRHFLRIPYFGYYLVILAICVLYMLYRQQLINFYEKIKNYYKENEDQGQHGFRPKRGKKMSLPSKLCLIENLHQEDEEESNKTHSYSMHSSQEYENVLKTLYTINKQERARVTCALNKELENLLFEKNYSKFLESDEQVQRKKPQQFYQLIQLVKKDFQKFEKRLGKEYSKSNNPFKYYLEQLKAIQRTAMIPLHDPEYEQTEGCSLEQRGFKSTSLKNLDLNYLKEKLSFHRTPFGRKKAQAAKQQKYTVQGLNQIVERSKEDSKSRSLNIGQSEEEQGPTSDVRLKWRPEMVSNLGVISNIQGDTPLHKKDLKTNPDQAATKLPSALKNHCLSNIDVQSKQNTDPNLGTSKVQELPEQIQSPFYLRKGEQDPIRETQSQGAGRTDRNYGTLPVQSFRAIQGISKKNPPIDPRMRSQRNMHDELIQKSQEKKNQRSDQLSETPCGGEGLTTPTLKRKSSRNLKFGKWLKKEKSQDNSSQN